MMTKIFKAATTAATFALILAAVSPAHAISEAYRKQLQREHKTQVQDANGYQEAVAPAAHFKAVHAKKYGVDFKRGTDGIAYANGSACATDEQNAQAASYQCGIHAVVVRATGRVDLLKNGQFVGHMN
ncbi:hypothetical protein [Citrobacter portucalensis]|uniref:hypothetical protein n=1 Tax=Citrobacter portucalensis TaxID=1639133 RepID=UPI00226B1876|nr:hypothetical protein [Citrobacter portucalensis]MCX8985126.1 hypothetical protein [Citrobacter portucalensis]